MTAHEARAELAEIQALSFRALTGVMTDPSWIHPKRMTRQERRLEAKEAVHRLEALLSHWLAEGT